MSETEAVHVIFYTHQISGVCAAVCACNCMHQIDKSEFVI